MEGLCSGAVWCVFSRPAFADLYFFTLFDITNSQVIKGLDAMCFQYVLGTLLNLFSRLYVSRVNFSHQVVQLASTFFNNFYPGSGDRVLFFPSSAEAVCMGVFILSLPFAAWHEFARPPSRQTTNHKTKIRAVLLLTKGWVTIIDMFHDNL